METIDSDAGGNGLASMPRRRFGIAAIVALLLAVAVVLVVAHRGSRSDPDVGTPAGGAPAPAARARVVGYFAQWGVYARNYQVRDVETTGSAARLTHLVYAFGSTAGGRCKVSDPTADYERVVAASDSVDGVADAADAPLRGSFGQLRKLKARHPQLRVLWSFGGWNGSAGFGEAARDPVGFAESCRQLLGDPRWAGVFDGIDIDWEYPNACGRQCDSSGRDALARLMSALRTAFGKNALVTAAITGDGTPGGRLTTADYAAAVAPLDWVMAMTYDYFGTGNTPGPTAPHSPLSDYPGIPRAGATTAGAVAALRAAGVPADKILLGIGFYGRGWAGVTRAEPGGPATGPAPGSYETGVEDYSVLRETCPPTGTVGGTAYALCRGQWWSYDTPATINTKLGYARQQHLGGAFVWELSGDTPDGELLAAVAANVAPPAETGSVSPR